MTKICVVGAFGNMGQRYISILNYLGIDILCHDKKHFPSGIEKCDGIIIATPTDTHFDMMLHYDTYNIPMLVEKPVTKNLDELIELCHLSTPWRMINQYDYFNNSKDNVCLKYFNDGSDFTIYDFYKSGSDSLPWDCINLIGLANGAIKLANNSPIWTCVLNGKKIDYHRVDYSYIWMISDWLTNFDDNRIYALKAHEKVIKFIKEMDQINDDRL